MNPEDEAKIRAILDEALRSGSKSPDDCEIIVRKHIPSGRQYVPADAITARAKWDDKRPFDEVFKGLNQATEKAIREWLNPWVANFEKPVPTASGISLPPTAQPPANQEPTPELDPAYLDTLGWTDFSPGPGQWIVAETTGAQALDEELTKPGQAIDIGTYRYRVSFGKPDKEGKRRKFVNRYPAK